MRSVRPWWLVAVLAVPPWAAGCTQRLSAPISEGTVTLDGQPLPNVVVDLVPVDDTDPPITGAESDEAGQFRLRSRGAGRYVVVVDEGDRGANGRRRRVPRRYTNPSTSPLEVVLPLEAPLVLALERE